jgi:hypothetical protein
MSSNSACRNRKPHTNNVPLAVTERRLAAGLGATPGAWAFPSHLRPCQRLQLIDLDGHRSQVGVQRLFPQTLMLGGEPLALGGELQALEDRVLVGDLADF